MTVIDVNQQPLAAQLRPDSLASFVGQQHLLAPGKPLQRAYEERHLHSMVFWGPPGVGKTTLATLLANRADCRLERLSAVTAGVKDLRAVVSAAQQAAEQGQRTVLFVDEIHRFNKAQQDAFLPHVEAGLFTLIGATTENPAFELNNALLSRVRVYVLKPLTDGELQTLLQQAIKQLAESRQAFVECSEALLQHLAVAADGDARRCLNFLELAIDLADGVVLDAMADESEPPTLVLTEATIANVTSGSGRRFDKGGDEFYDQISALHKSVRGSDPDAAMYWFLRMCDGGVDPRYLARRLIRIASEDIGNADPRALSLALAAAESYERLGSPEGELALVQAAVYLACAPKSNAVYKAAKAVQADIKAQGTLPVPEHLRNAPTALARSLGHGKAYRYAHDYPEAFVPGERYLPEALNPSEPYYQPVARGLEIKIAEKLARLRATRAEPSKND